MKNTIISLCSILFLFFTQLNANPEEVIAVCVNCKYRKIQEAIDKAKDGSVVLIKKGLYKESIIINKKITLMGEESAIINGQHQGHTILIKANNVTVKNLQIEASGSSDIVEYAGIYGDGIEGCKIQNNRLLDNVYGIYLSKSKNCALENNTLEGNALDEVRGGNGVHLWNSNFIHISSNLIQKHRDGLYFEFSEGLTITDNQAVENIRYGLHFMFSHGSHFSKNIFDKNGAGVAIMYSRKIDVSENVFRNSKGLSAYGLLLKDINDSRFYDNTITQNTYGIYADNANRNTFEKNLFERNGWGMLMPGNSDSNKFIYNDFLNNFFDIATNSKENNNIYKSNFWSSYRGFDLNRDGLGDVPHRPVPVFGYWVAGRPFLSIMLLSPVIQFLELAEKAFPVLTPITLEDREPSLAPNTQGKVNGRATL